MSITTQKLVQPYKNHTTYYAAGDAAGDVLYSLTPQECDQFDSFVFCSAVGVVTIEVSLDASQARWSNPVALQDMAGTLIDQAAVTTTGNLYGLVGRFSGLRVKTSGAAASCDMSAWASGRKS